MHAGADSRNARLQHQYEDIDSILSSTLNVDDYVDLETLRTVALHPPFERTDLEIACAPPPALVAPPEPVFVQPDGAPKGLGAMFGGKKHYAERMAQAQAAFAQQHDAWQRAVGELPAAQLKQTQAHEARETERLALLAEARRSYAAECAKREADAQATNLELDALIAGLAANEPAAVQEYVSIVLSRSIYPECFPVSHDFEFDALLRELALTVLIPAPSELPDVKEYRYVKAKDEIASTPLSQKERKDRYANAAWQVALRSMHEIFEADRDHRIQTIALTVAVDTVDAATGLPRKIALVAVASDRDTFTTYDLAKVVPLATLQHLNALVSKNPFELVEIDTSKGVRGT
jgi:restriction system protein